MAGIVISGTRPDEWIRFAPTPEISASSFVVSVCLCGRTASTHLDVLDTDKFLVGLREFERTRSGQAILEGTYDFRLVVRPHGRTGAAWIGFHLAEWLPWRTVRMATMCWKQASPLRGNSLGRCFETSRAYWHRVRAGSAISALVRKGRRNCCSARSGNFQQGLRILGSNHEQSAGSSGRRSPSLLPILQGPYRHA
jgi:hypothetical protein